MKYKVILPVLFLLLVAGQMSAEFCMARCEGMSTRMLAHACGMHGMAQGQCAMCNHAPASGTNSATIRSKPQPADRRQVRPRSMTHRRIPSPVPISLKTRIGLKSLVQNSRDQLL